MGSSSPYYHSSVCSWTSYRIVLEWTADFFCFDLANLLTLIVVFIFLCFLLSYAKNVLQESVGYEVAARERIDLGNILKRVSLGYFSKNSVGDILAGITTELSALELQSIKMVDAVICCCIAGNQQTQ